MNRHLLIACLATGLLTGCAADGGLILGPAYDHPAQKAGVPPGHMPPPGKCRIWYPDRPPGQQPPPGDCRELRHHVPPGASLIRG